VSGSVFGNGLIDTVDVDVSDIYTASAGVLAQYQFKRLALYGGAYYIRSEASVKGMYGQAPVDLLLEDDNTSRLLLGVNVPLADNVSLDLESHFYNDFSFAVTVNYYPFKEKQVRKVENAKSSEVAESSKIKVAAPTEFENQIYFEPGSVEVGESEYPKIRALARFLLKRPGSDVIIEGHCDCFGEEEFNQELSEKRALSVKKLLINFYNIPEDSILVVGYGESFPIASNTTEEGRTKNRRVRVYATE
jgi:outer membrane protein OmpA-like peptidoglycan-associated protein